MRALLVDVDGVVEEIDVGDRADIESVVGGRAAPVPLGAVARHLAASPHRRLAVWVGNCDVLDESPFRPNPLATAVVEALESARPKMLHGPVVFVETTDDAPLVTLGDDATELLTGIARSWTLDNLEQLTAVSRERRLTAVMNPDTVEILDTTNLENVVSLRDVASAGGVVAADRALDRLGYERTGPWQSAEFLLEDPDTDVIQASIRRK